MVTRMKLHLPELLKRVVVERLPGKLVAVKQCLQRKDLSDGIIH